VSTGIVALILVVLVLLVVAVIAAGKARRKMAGRNDYGPEYDRLAREVGPQRATAEFANRRQRVDGLHIRPLAQERRAAYAGQWEAVQEQFVDQPAQAVRTAGTLISSVAADRGYDATDHDQLVTDLSVHHGRYLDGYRHAWQTADQAGRASTEDQRRALLDYRGIFFDLLGQSGNGGVPAPRQGPCEARGDAQADKPWKQLAQGRPAKTERRQDSGTFPEPGQ
jgi:hypothetical protein